MKKILFILLLLPAIGQSQVKYDYFRINNESLVYERIFDAAEGYKPTLIKQLNAMRGVNNFTSNDSIISFYVKRIIPQENEISIIKAYDKGFQKLRITSLSFSAIVYMKGNKYKVVLTNIMNSSGADPRFNELSDMTYAVYSPKNKRFRKWSELFGHTVENYLSLLFTLNDVYKTSSDW